MIMKRLEFSKALFLYPNTSFQRGMQSLFCMKPKVLIMSSTQDYEQQNLKGISRMDFDNTHGWFVRIYHRGSTHRKLFSDSIHGSQDSALNAAIAYRDEYLRKHHIDDLPFFTFPMKSNTSGVNGVSETFHRSRNGRKIPYFSVFWAPKRNKRRNKRFYIHHYDSRENALQAATAFRKEKEQEILARYQAGEYE